VSLERLIRNDRSNNFDREHGDLIEDSGPAPEAALNAEADEQAPAKVEADDEIGQEGSKSAETPAESQHATPLPAFPQAMLGMGTYAMATRLPIFRRRDQNTDIWNSARRGPEEFDDVLVL
jgi:hypothetical protein